MQVLVLVDKHVFVAATTTTSSTTTTTIGTTTGTGPAATAIAVLVSWKPVGQQRLCFVLHYPCHQPHKRI
jgi:hypothetical protein